MRINVYARYQITGEVELVEKAGVIGADGEPVTFYGVRFYLEGSDKLHRTEHDDDRPAITYWVGTREQAGGLFGAMEEATQVARETYRKLIG